MNELAHALLSGALSRLSLNVCVCTSFIGFPQGKDLPAKDLSGTSDPYVRVTLLPDKKHRLETKIKRRTLNPRWNETFYFEGMNRPVFHSFKHGAIHKNRWY